MGAAGELAAIEQVDAGTGVASMQVAVPLPMVCCGAVDREAGLAHLGKLAIGEGADIQASNLEASVKSSFLGLDDKTKEALKYPNSSHRWDSHKLVYC